MKIQSLLMAGAAAATLAFAGQASAHDKNSPCADVLCHSVALFPVDAASGGGEGMGLNTVARKYGTWGFDPSAMDTSVKPGDNMFNFAEGKAVAALEIPSDRPRYGSFDMLRELSDNRVKALVEGFAAHANAAGSDEAKIADAYKSFMDEARVEKLDAKPLAGDLARIKAMKTRDDVAKSMGASQGVFGGSFFAAYVSEDAKDPQHNALYLFQSGIGLPDRDYYLKDTFAEKKTKYQAYVATQLKNAGWANPDAAAKSIVELETKIATVHWTAIENRDDNKTYNPMSVAELQKLAPAFPWKTWMQAAGLSNVDRVIVAQNTAFPKIAQIFAETPVETLKAWQTFHTVDQAAPYLSKRFADASFNFNQKELSGTPMQRPRWKRAGSFTEQSLGEAVGRAYVKAYFPPESKAKMEKLVADLRVALKARIQRLEWMSPETKTKALAKLDKFGVKIGYPNKWRDYSGLKIDSADLYGNVERSGRFEWAYMVAKLSKPVDKDEWGMTPQTVNAYYQPTRNEIVFPAAILQPPFFDPNADMAVNYGGIGGVIGHEMTHGFDDQGRHYDGDGVLTDWWQASDSEKFDAKAKAFGAQYDTYEVAGGVHVQGGLTMGENIADLGGLNMGLDAYHASLNGQPAPVIDGFTGDQRVFLGWAQVWREKARDDYRRQMVTTNPHSPADFRVIGPMRNIDAWYDAFGVKDGKYYLKPEDRVRIW